MFACWSHETLPTPHLVLSAGKHGLPVFEAPGVARSISGSENFGHHQKPHDVMLKRSPCHHKNECSGYFEAAKSAVFRFPKVWSPGETSQTVLHVSSRWPKDLPKVAQLGTLTVCVCVYIYISIYLYMYISICITINVYILYISICKIYVYIYICIYTSSPWIWSILLPAENS